MTSSGNATAPPERAGDPCFKCKPFNDTQRGLLSYVEQLAHTDRSDFADGFGSRHAECIVPRRRSYIPRDLKETSSLMIFRDVVVECRRGLSTVEGIARACREDISEYVLSFLEVILRRP
jgi:hypothetical protein